MTSSTLSIVIPTYGREVVLLETVQALLHQSQPAGEILVIDQTPKHLQATAQQLQEWQDQGVIRWVQRNTPGIPQAMNVGLQQAKSDLVLFLDDDIVPQGNLIQAHVNAHETHDVDAVVGQILQPGEQAENRPAPRRWTGLRKDFDFPFHSALSGPIANVMAGNLSVRRDRAIRTGGFDEQFCGSAYRFESDFARRLIAGGGRIWFCAEAGIRHLRVPTGGTRQKGDHRASSDPRHGVGDYYYAMRHGRTLEALRYMGWRTIREVCTRFHRRHPWAIPVKLLGEVRAWWWARRLYREGPKLLSTEPVAASDARSL